MQILFYGTPIVYQLTDVPEKIGGILVRAIVELSPLTQYTIQSRQVTYLLEFPTLRQVGYTFVVSLITLVFGWWVFSRRAGRDRGDLMSQIVVDDVSKRFRLYTSRAFRSGSGSPPGLRRWLRGLLGVARRQPEVPRHHLRPDRPQRLGQSPAAALHRQDLPADVGDSLRRRSDLGPAGARCGFHPDLTGKGEHLPQRRHPPDCRPREIDAVFDDIVDFSGIAGFTMRRSRCTRRGCSRLGFAVAVHVNPRSSSSTRSSPSATGSSNVGAEHIHSLRRSGVTIVLVSHNLGWCGRCAITQHGSTTGASRPWAPSTGRRAPT